MATNSDLWTLFNDATMQQKVAVGVILAAEAIRTENSATTNHANRLKWAKQAFDDPVTAAQAMLKALLAQNSTMTLTDLQNATDSAINTAVANAVDIFADGT